MTVEEFINRLNAFLLPYGGSYSRPSGWLKDGLAFSCIYPPINIPFPESLNEAQRALIIERLERLPKTGA
jgi:hypothetical protein